MLKNMILGIFISIADLVPGISGGTIMIISGKYYDIIHYVNEMMKFKFTRKANIFIFPILAGWIIGIASFVKIIDYLMLNFKDEMYGTFSGLIIGSVLYLLKDIKKEKKLSILIISISFLVSLILFMIINNVKMENIEVTWWYLLISSFIASVVMPLPGISGSTMFLIFGVYSSIIKFVAHMEIINLLPVIIGMIVGWFSTVKILNILFEKYKTTILEILLGITLAGAIRIIPVEKSIYPYIFIVVGLAASLKMEIYFKK